MKDICQSFRFQACTTDDLLRRGSAIGFQHAEETITDNILFSLSENNSTEIKIHTFSKHAEGINGADWEWWITNASRSQWLGMRIQAKVLNLKSRKFEHLHYKSGKSKVYQSIKLRQEALADGLVPMYCLYSFHDNKIPHPARICHTYPSNPDLSGCSLVAVSDIETLRAKPDNDSYDTVMKNSFPWHCLVCCSGWGGNSLPERTWHWLNAQSTFLSSLSTEDEEKNFKKLGLRNKLPEYVSKIINNQVSPDDIFEHKRNVKGILIITGSDRG